MVETFSWRFRSGLAAAAFVAALATVVVLAVVAGRSRGSVPAGTVAVVPASATSVVVADASTVPVVLEFGDHAMAATLADTPASRDLVAALPVTLVLTDTWGQAKSGRLPHPVRTDGAAPVFRPASGGIYYWPGTAALAVYYDDLSQSVPPPGLIRLGSVDARLDEIADAGRMFTVRIDLAS